MVSPLERSASGLVLVAKTVNFLERWRRSLGETQISAERCRNLAFVRCHYLFLVDCERSMTSEPRLNPHQRIEEVRALMSSKWSKNKGQIQILECVCPCPAPGNKLLAKILSELGYSILGRNASLGKKPLKSILAWTMDEVAFRAAIPKLFIKTFEAERDGWHRHCQVFPLERQGQQVKSLATEVFCGHRFLCDGVMVPRLGTEIIAEEASRELRKRAEKSDSVSLLDLGTGSGCIAISALLKLPETLKASAVGLDISATAVKVAQRNATLLPSEKSFSVFQMCFSQLASRETSSSESSLQAMKQGFDVIVSNPPYLTRRQAQEVSRGEPVESYVLQRSAQVAKVIGEERRRLKCSLDGPLAVYGILKMGILGEKEPLLKPGGALVIEARVEMSGVFTTSGVLMWTLKCMLHTINTAKSECVVCIL